MLLDLRVFAVSFLETKHLLEILYAVWVWVARRLNAIRTSANSVSFTMNMA